VAQDSAGWPVVTTADGKRTGMPGTTTQAFAAVSDAKYVLTVIFPNELPTALTHVSPTPYAT